MRTPTDNVLVLGNLREHGVKNYILFATFCRRKCRCIFNHFYVMRPESYRIRWNNAKLRLLRRSRSFKVTEFGTNQKLICDFLLVFNTNLPPLLHCFRDMAYDASSRSLKTTFATVRILRMGNKTVTSIQILTRFDRHRWWFSWKQWIIVVAVKSV